jgi:hypothetical protein
VIMTLGRRAIFLLDAIGALLSALLTGFVVALEIRTLSRASS